MLPRAALEHEAQQERLTEVTLRGLRRVWRKMRGRRWETAWKATVGPQMTELVAAAQEAAAAQSARYMTDVLTELNIPAAAPTQLITSAFVGVAGDGRPVDTLLYGGVIRAAKAQYEPHIADLPKNRIEEAALAAAEAWIQEAATTIIADTARAAETTAMTQREWLTGWIRMIEPGACSRCVVLAGKFYLHNEGFERHPACKCHHIPADENIATDLFTNPQAYFDSLTAAEQDRAFTTAGAEAIRLGADIGQVVNARRGMHTAQQNPRDWIPKGRLKAVKMFGRDAFVTTEGVTKHGIYGRIRGNKPVRLMPESILTLAVDRADALRLLRVYGYIT